ncbi:hypothetical protein J6Z19_00140, partial [bacterium]|nr:hypothetical protein [bacterium]
MKCFSGFLLIFVFFFFAACDSVNGVKKVVPENEGNKEAETDEDAEEDDSDSTNEDENADLIDDSGDSSDSDVEPVYDDSSDVEPADNDSTDEKPAGEEDDDVIPDSPEAKCKKVGGTWDSSAQKCYRTETCGDKPEYTEWNGDSTYKVYYDLNVEVWEPLTYPTHYGDGKPEICQYKCIANYSYVNGGCKPYCSAVFDGESSQIQVEHNDLLNLASETWTIEAWIKQGEGDIPTYV